MSNGISRKNVLSQMSQANTVLRDLGFFRAMSYQLFGGGDPVPVKTADLFWGGLCVGA